MSAPGAGWPRVQVHPGAGVVARHGDGLLVVPALPPSGPAAVRELLELCGRAAPGGGPASGALLALARKRTPGQEPGFALLVRQGRTLRVVQHGGVRVLVDGRPLEGPGGGPAEHVVDDDTWQALTVAAAGAHLPDDDALALDLEAGAVPGAGVTLRRARRPVAAPPDRAGPDRSTTTLQPAVRFRSVLLGECAVRAAAPRALRQRAPLPVAGERPPDPDEGSPAALVEGVHCPSGHLTDPDLAACLRCGAPLPPGAPRVRAPRPPLGILVTDGGTIHPVVGDLVIGREPEQAPDVLAGRARPLPLRDEARSTSRVHARVTVQGWTVLLRDEGSANGTFVSAHGAAGPWLPLPPDTPVRLAHGDRLRLGRRQLLFDTWREALLPQVQG